MKLGLMFANTVWGASAAGAVAIAEAAEAGGFESIWTVEHVVVPSGYESRYPYDPSGKMAGGAEEFDLPDPLIWLSYVAARTTTLKLGTGILILPQRNPLIVAKELASLDALSGGRMICGIGVGWLEEEFDALGVPFHDRGARCDDTVDVLRKAWTGQKVSHSSPYTTFTDCISLPRPANGTVPIVVGGDSPAAARRAGRLGDGYFPGNGAIDHLRGRLDIMRRAAEEAGRDPDAIEISAGAGGRSVDDIVARAEALREVGVTRLMLGLMPPDQVLATGEALRARLAD
ncbi:MAG: LLM class F420-dependent oxidoreductase [Ilumatobacteraceae bacterium]|nr:LLM class F420-dependent oxidoreductase [Ilumatobacteraceae bacterium]